MVTYKHEHTAAFQQHTEPGYLHRHPLVSLFGEVYQVQTVVHKVFQTAVEISVRPDGPEGAVALVCSHAHLHGENTKAQTKTYKDL